MPKFTLCFDIDRVKGKLFLGADQEAQLSGDAEVRDGEESYFFEDGVSGQFDINLLIAVQVVNGEWRYLHNVSNIQQVQPLTLIQIPQQNFHVQRLALLHG